MVKTLYALFLPQMYALLCMHYSYSLVCVKGGTQTHYFADFSSIIDICSEFFKRDFDQLGSGILDLSLAFIDFLKGHSIVALLKITMNLSGLSQIIIQKLPKIHTCKPIICYDDGR